MLEMDGYRPEIPAPANDAMALGPAPLAIIIGRIEEVVDEETAGLKGGSATFDLKASNARKSRCLYELNRAVRSLRDAASLAEHKTGLIRLRDKLARNETVLRAHMSAVSEIAALMQTTIRAAETDGTYSASGYGDGF